MTDGQRRPTPPDELKEPHLLDLANFQEVAMWLLATAASGAVGNVAYDVLRAVRKRFGSDRLAELRQQIYEEMKDVRRKRHLSNRELRARVDRLFAELDR